MYFVFISCGGWDCWDWHYSFLLLGSDLDDEEEEEEALGKGLSFLASAINVSSFLSSNVFYGGGSQNEKAKLEWFSETKAVSSMAITNS